MAAAFDLTCGIGWTIVYLAAIYRGIKYKTWCIPSVAICFNVVWEGLIVLNRFISGNAEGQPFVIQVIWFLLDIIILITWLWYDRRRVLQNLTLLVCMVMIVLVCCWYLEAWAVSAFVDNMIMSALFLYHFYKSPGEWLSITVAIGKMVGTLGSTLVSGFLNSNMIIIWLGGICLILDIMYIGEIYQYRKGV